jgi:hypothetical protein
LAVWVVDTDSESEWKVRRDEHFEQLIKDRWNDRVAILVVDVGSKHAQTGNASSGVRCSSGVTSAQGSAAPDIAQGSSIPDIAEGSGDTASSPPPSAPVEVAEEVNWAELTILAEPNEDGEAKEVVDEDQVYEAMGFKASGEAAREAVPIPTMTAEMQSDMAEAAVPVDDHVDEEPMFD